MKEGEVKDDYGRKLDQGKAAMYDLGLLAASYYKALAEAGVPAQQAGQITATYVATSKQFKKDVG